MDKAVKPEVQESASNPRAKRACDHCKSKKAKCSGDQPTCRKCKISNRTCVYSPYEKRISILLGRYTEMNDTIERLRTELKELKEATRFPDKKVVVTPKQEQSRFFEAANEHEFQTTNQIFNSHTSPKSTQPQIKRIRLDNDSSKFKTGSSESIFSELAGKKRGEQPGISPNSVPSLSLLSSQSESPASEAFSKQSYSEIIRQNSASKNKEKYDIRVYSYLSKLSLGTAFDLIEICHFYLNDIYFPYDVNLMKSKLKRIYSPVTNFSDFFLNSTCFFKSLVFLTFALGKRYHGDSDEVITDLLYSSLLEILPITEVKESTENYLIVSTLTLASLYFRAISQDSDSVLYSNLALQFASHIKLHEDENENTNMKYYERELKSRIMWIAYGVNRSLSAKMGDAFLLNFDQIQRSFPIMKSFDETGNLISFAKPTEEVENRRPNSEEFQLYIELTKAAEEIYRVIYSSKPATSLIEELGNLIERLVNWNNSLPERFKLDLSSTTSLCSENKKSKRLVYSLHLNYCFCIHLTTIPILYSLVDKKNINETFEISGNCSDLLAICINSAQMTVYILINCLNDGLLAIFGVMDLDYVYSASLTFFMCGDILDFQFNDCRRLLDSCLMILNSLATHGNYNATLKYEKLKELIQGHRKLENPDREDEQQIQYSADAHPLEDQEDNEQMNEQEQEHKSRRYPMFFQADTNSNSANESRLDYELLTNMPLGSPLSSNVANTFHSLTDGDDLDFWDYGKSWQRIDSYWEDFQRNVFNKN